LIQLHGADMKKTEWYMAAIRPARPGIYEVYRPCFIGDNDIDPYHRLKWTGTGWQYCEPVGICDDGDTASMERRDKWRGLTEQPK
jgi:hypothetical protein